MIRNDYNRFVFELSGFLHLFYASLCFLAHAFGNPNRLFIFHAGLIHSFVAIILNIEFFAKSKRRQNEELTENNGENEYLNDDMKTDEDDQSYVPPNESSSSSSSSESEASN